MKLVLARIGFAFDMEMFVQYSDRGLMAEERTKLGNLQGVDRFLMTNEGSYVKFRKVR